jgi:hypothetical protein
MVEMRVGDMYLLQGMIASMQLNWGGDAKIWETIPGGRTLKGCAITLNLEVIHYEQPHAGYDFWSPTFNPKVFYPNWNDKSNSLAQTTNEQNQNNKSIFEKVSETIDGITNNIPSELTGVINF